MTSTHDTSTYLVAGDYGSGPQIDESEVYNDAAYAWQQADELQEEAEAEGESVTYGVYALTAIERPGQP